MTFLHPLLLGGLVLVGLPVLIHLIMRQKPKRLPFPAFRFLLQKHRTNQTRLRLRHLLLLLLRMAIIAALCLALVRPSVTGGVLLPGGDSPVNAVLVIDTSASMEYTLAGKSRLDEAKRRAGELLDELPDGSKIAILDSAEVNGEWERSPSSARDRIASLRLRHANAALPRQIEQAYRLLTELDRGVDNPTEALPKVLYVFSDRTYGCWDEQAAKGLTQPPGINAVFVDVGVDEPADLAIVEVKPEPLTLRPGDTVKIAVTVQATGADYDTEIVCAFDGEAHGQRLPLKLQAGRTQTVTFERAAAGRARAGEAQQGLAEGLHQVEVRLANGDAMPFDNTGFATFRVLEGRPVLVLTDDREAADNWADLLADTFRPRVHLLAEASTLPLENYAVVCLFNVARPDAALWDRLWKYVSGGHGLMVVLGGDKGGPDPAAYSSPQALQVLPARPEKVLKITDDKERFWAEFQGDSQRLSRHSLLEPFRRWKGGDVDFFKEEGKPRVSQFWKVAPLDGQSDVLTHYTDRDGSPALLERVIDRGRVILFTTALKPRREADANPDSWNSYFALSSFGFVLSNLTVSYLAGDATEPTLNYVTGQTVPIALPDKFSPTYVLAGPGILGQDATLTRQPEQHELRIAQATSPGNFVMLAVDDNHAKRVAAFSMNPRPDEYRLDRVPVEQIEALLGPESVLPVGRNASLRDRLQERWAPPLELTPWLLIALLLSLAVESLLANRFYRRPAGEAEEPAVGLEAARICDPRLNRRWRHERRHDVQHRSHLPLVAWGVRPAGAGDRGTPADRADCLDLSRRAWGLRPPGVGRAGVAPRSAPARLSGGAATRAGVP